MVFLEKKGVLDLVGTGTESAIPVVALGCTWLHEGALGCLLVVGTWLFVPGTWLLAVGTWLLVVGSWLLVVGTRPPRGLRRPWTSLDVLGLHLVALGCTWLHLVALGRTW